MTFLKLYHKLFCVMQWSIGISRGDIKTVIKAKDFSLKFKWIALQDKNQSIADPFLFKDDKGNFNLLYEDFSMRDLDRYGKVFLAKIDNNLEVSDQQIYMDAGKHISYPFIFLDENGTYLIPETSSLSKVSSYDFKAGHNGPGQERVIVDKVPLLDSTIIKYRGKFWLFATQSSPEFENSRLFIYYSDQLHGPYLPHLNNPVKENNDGSRPAGNLIEIDGELYRPAQNCSIHYGESITVNKIIELTETDFKEEVWFKIKPDANSKFNSGVHTLNALDDIIVIDGIRMTFDPVTKWKLFLKKKFNKSTISAPALMIQTGLMTGYGAAIEYLWY